MYFSIFKLTNVIEWKYIFILARMYSNTFFDGIFLIFEFMGRKLEFYEIQNVFDVFIY